MTNGLLQECLLSGLRSDPGQVGEHGRLACIEGVDIGWILLRRINAGTATALLWVCAPRANDGLIPLHYDDQAENNGADKDYRGSTDSDSAARSHRVLAHNSRPIDIPAVGLLRTLILLPTARHQENGQYQL